MVFPVLPAVLMWGRRLWACMSGSVACGLVLGGHFSPLLHADFSCMGVWRTCHGTFVLFSCSRKSAEWALYEVGQGVPIRGWDGKTNETEFRQLLDGASSTHSWIRVNLQNIFFIMKVWRISFTHKMYLSQRMLLEGCLLNYKLKDMKEGKNVSFLPCYPFYLHWPSSIPVQSLQLWLAYCFLLCD